MLYRDDALTKHCHAFIAGNLMHISDRDDFCDYVSGCPGMVKRMLRLYKGACDNHTRLIHAPYV
jgi:hypothetical protein